MSEKIQIYVHKPWLKMPIKNSIRGQIFFVLPIIRVAGLCRLPFSNVTETQLLSHPDIQAPCSFHQLLRTQSQTMIIQCSFFDALQTRSDLSAPINETVRPLSQFPHSCICERLIDSHNRPTYFPAAKQADRSVEYKNRSQIHECRWGGGGGRGLGRVIIFM